MQNVQGPYYFQESMSYSVKSSRGGERCWGTEKSKKNVHFRTREAPCVTRMTSHKGTRNKKCQRCKLLRPYLLLPFQSFSIILLAFLSAKHRYNKSFIFIYLFLFFYGRRTTRRKLYIFTVAEGEGGWIYNRDIYLVCKGGDEGGTVTAPHKFTPLLYYWPKPMTEKLKMTTFSTSTKTKRVGV